MATAFVTEPDVVYEEQIRDVARFVEASFLTQIQEIASDFSIRDSANLKREIKDALGSVCYLENGISISNVSVMVQVDKEYEKLLRENRNLEYNTEFERKKAEAAKQMKEIYDDNITAIFSEFAAGNISSEEAIARSKKGLSQDFDERMRQIEKVTEYIKGLERDEMINKGDTLNKVNTLLNGLVSSVQNISLEDKGNEEQALEEREQAPAQEVYQSFEDDEE